MSRRGLTARSGSDSHGVGDGGFTLVELTITIALASVVMTAILGMLVSQSNAEKRMSTFADNQEVAREAVVAMQRDIRSSEPLKQLATSADYELRIDLNVYDDINAANPTPIRWLVDTTNKELRREQLDAAGNVIGVSHRLTGVQNAASPAPSNGTPLFSFYKANTVAYSLVGATADQPKDIAECTVRVHIELIAGQTAGPAPARNTSDAELRNRLPGGVGCPITPVSGP